MRLCKLTQCPHCAFIVIPYVGDTGQYKCPECEDEIVDDDTELTKGFAGDDNAFRD